MSKIAFKKTVLAVALTIGGVYGATVAQAQTTTAAGGWFSADLTSVVSSKMDQISVAISSGSTDIAKRFDELAALVIDSTNHEVAALQKSIDIAQAELASIRDAKQKQELVKHINDLKAGQKKIQESGLALVDKINQSKALGAAADIAALNKAFYDAAREINIAKNLSTSTLWAIIATINLRDDAIKSLKDLALDMSRELAAYDAGVGSYGSSGIPAMVAVGLGADSDKGKHKKISDGAISALKTAETKTLEADFYGRRLVKHDVDIFFLSDNTGSMGGLIRSAQTHAQAILDGLRDDARFAKVNAQFGVGRYLGDPSERGESATSAYQLLQGITSSDTDIKAAINEWYARGGGDLPEGNFYGIQQAITGGEGTPRDATLKSGQNTGWREGAEKVIVVFGDAPSWQNSVNEKELKALARATGARIVFIDTEEINSGSGFSNVYDATKGQQMKDAALEIADASGGSYMRLTDVSKITDAVLDSVYDALADNKWTGGMLARMDRNTWRVRTPSSVMAESTDDGKTLTFVLRYPNQPESRFTVSKSAAKVAGRGYYEGSISDSTNIFGRDLSANSVFHVNDEQDFFRFILNGAGNTVEGYYGERLSDKAKLAASGVSVYDLRHRVTGADGSYSGASDGMKLFVNWATGKVYGIDVNAAMVGVQGTALFVGDLDRDALDISGKYVFNTRSLNSGNIPRITDARRDTTTLQLYGKDGVSGMGGTFGATFYHPRNPTDLGAMQMSGYLNKHAVASAYTPGQDEVWKGFANGWVRDGGTVSLGWSGIDDVQVTLRPETGEVKAEVQVRDGTGVLRGFSSDWTDTNAYLNQHAFVAVKDMDGAPSYVAAAGDDGFDYLAWGVWSTEQAGRPGTVVMDGSHWIAGTMTQTVDMPTTGTASYAGQVHGMAHEGGALHALNGTSALNANFGTGNITGQLNVQYANTGKAYATSHLGGVSISGNKFSGALAGANNSGHIEGAFFGKNAAEVGGQWAFGKTDGSGSLASGVFTGKQK